MSEPGSLDAATRRLNDAVAALEEALARRREIESEEATLAQQIHVLGLDRSRLADALDGEKARAEHLATVNQEVSRRLGSAMETIRAVLTAHER
ncbi:DUF4164 domain-containing protein [Ancylobacter sp. 6x-1]|uniref:DUF4164 domain-containing protein n=1 Tax=Ancylobacter crimeensis TaxID=2579147 RepID=A0ABT0DEA8_9HYPH|nr:DUF4164 family protein [Ancylobacter crimeensis]MCK0198295.1 DUF4164 domain-containing protein [Ancylobacter crimeensis]